MLVSRMNDGRVPPNTSTVRTRDVAALVRPAPYAPAASSPDDVRRYRDVIAQVFEHATIVPAPCGTVFRSTEQVRRWLDQNYIALCEGLHFLAGRCEGRVHVTRRAGDEAPDASAAQRAAEACYEHLRRGAAAALVLPASSDEAVLDAAFLVERERWSEFADVVDAQAREHAAFDVDCTGPWPPYDFVRLELGA